MIGRVFAFFSIGMAALVAQMAPAGAVQLQLPESPEPEIVVYGVAQDDAVLGDFVRAIGSEADSGQLARWQGSICPQVIGMREEFNAYVRGTIRSVADLAGARVGGDGCRHNVLVVMTDNPRAYIDGLRGRRGDLFVSLDASERARLVESGNAVSTWSRLAVRGGDGREIQAGEVSYNARGAGTEALPYRRITGARASRIARSVRTDLDFRAIVIDLSRLNGQTMQQLSAFAAMLALGEFDVSQRISPERTILNLFHDPVASPADLSDWDLGYLRGLYATNAGRDAHRQRSAIIRHIRRNIGR